LTIRSSNRRRPSAAGFTLLEVLFALLLISIGVLAAAPMFLFAMRGNTVGADFGVVGAVAVQQLEELRAVEYDSLVAGGNLDVNETGYCDTSDPDYVVRWQIVENVSPVDTKTIQLRSIALREVVGQRKEVTITTLRSR